MFLLRRIYLSLCLAFVLMGCTRSCQGTNTAAQQSNNTQMVTPEATPVSELKRIVFLGDSLTAGYGLDPSQAFPALIQKKADESDKPWIVVNAGVSGDTTSGAVSRLDWVFKNKVEILFICLGANDGFRGIPVPEIEKNLETILQRGVQENATMILAGMQMPMNYGATYVKEFEAVFPRLAQKYKVQYVPFLLEGVAGVDSLNQADRIHPTAQGAAKIADLVWNSIENLL